MDEFWGDEQMSQADPETAAQQLKTWATEPSESRLKGKKRVG